MRCSFTEEQLEFAIQWWIEGLPKKPGVSQSRVQRHTLFGNIKGVQRFDLSKSGERLVSKAMQRTFEGTALTSDQICALEKVFREKLSNEADIITQRLNRIEEMKGEDEKIAAMRTQSGMIRLWVDYGPVELLGEIFNETGIRELKAPGILSEKTTMYISPLGFVQVENERTRVKGVYSADDITCAMLQSKSSDKLRNGFHFTETDVPIIIKMHKMLENLLDANGNEFIEKLYLYSCGEVPFNIFTTEELAFFATEDVIVIDEKNNEISDVIKNTVISSVSKSGVTPEGYALVSPFIPTTKAHGFSVKPNASLIEKFKQNHAEAIDQDAADLNMSSLKVF